MRTKGISNTKQVIDRVLENKSKELTPVSSSVVERMKVLDKDFKASVEGIEDDWLQETSAKLRNVVADMEHVQGVLMDRVKDGGKTLTVRELITVMDSLRKWIGDVQQMSNLQAGKPGKIIGHLHAHRHRFEIEDLSLLSDEEIDQRIKQKVEAIGYKMIKIDKTPIPISESFEALDSDSDNEDSNEEEV
jgi:hypothetical protein